MAIDIHIHAIFQEFVQDLSATPEGALVLKELEFTSKNYYGRSPNILSLADFQREMDEAGVEKVVLQVAALKGVPARPMNEQVSQLLQMLPDKFIGFAGFDPNQGEEAVDDIEYAVKELGFKGVKTVASVLEMDINDRAFYPSYTKAQELGVPIMIHTGAVVVTGCRVKHVHPLMVDDVAFDFPELKIICAHLGGYSYMDVHNILVRHPNVYADLSFWPLNPYYKDLIPWRLLEETVPDKILLGSDYPFGQTPKEAAEGVESLPVSHDFKRKILEGNATELLSL
jgi:predicted TIM-barrel fold metal-dependent hydrolase